jgi:small subunit ribosomal protein S5
MRARKILNQRISVTQCGELVDKTISIRRVAKVVKGGRRFSFSALVVTGDGQGHVGVGLGKAAEVPEAIRKAGEQARKSLVRVPMKGSTLTHEVVGNFGPTKVVMKPAGPGTGVIAGGAVRAVLEASGVRDVRTKCVGSNTPHNVVWATLEGVSQLRDPRDVEAERGKSLEELGYAPF